MAPPSLPPRKFAPEPVETSHKSSKDARQPSPEKKPRRFAPEPVEVSQKSSKDGRQVSPDKAKPRRFAVEPVETEHKSSKDRNANAEEKPKPRRFAVEPVATEHKSSRDKQSSGTSKPRRFAPQLVETEEKSSKVQKLDQDQEKAGHVKFMPQPVETLYRTNRKPSELEGNGEAKGPRRFAPILLDTAKRSRRAGDHSSAPGGLYKTESGHHIHAREHRRHIRGDKTPVGDDEGPMGEQTPDYSNGLDIPSELRRQLAPMDGSAPARRPSISSPPERQHSFRCPDLDTIESSESERASNTSSLSSSPGQGSPITASDSSYPGTGYKHATRTRESVDESFSQYLLDLEAKKAQQRLRELANDAFPNSDFHEPIQHYMNAESDSDEMEIEDRPVTYDMEEELLLEMAQRRESTAKMSWEQLEMQRHAEKMEQDRRAERTTQKQPTESPWWKPPVPDTYGLDRQEEEMRSMRDRARPPMLGSDIVFPRSSSPEPARFDVTQGSTMLRNQMCYLTEHAESTRERTGEEEGLWQPRAPVSPIARDTTLNSPTSSKKGSGGAVAKVAGLWGGFCLDDGEAHASPSGLMVPPQGPTGLMTPAPVETANPFEQSFQVPSHLMPESGGLMTPPTPPRSVNNGELGRIDGILSAEQDLDEVMENEFPDEFVTQVYNYLSLGYPSLARPFDEELSKISRIPIAELRGDDKRAKQTPRGYIRLGPDFEGGGGEGLSEENCMRWRALKLYVREWARQEKNMVKTDGPGGNWGTGARRGSWAI